MKDRLGVLDGLRGIAILLVLWYHLWIVGHLPALAPWLQFIPASGLYGVHLFFFLSGFVILYPFARAQFAGQPEPRWAHFFWRRFIKIVPSYVLSIVIAYAIGFAAYQRLQTHTTVLQELITHALFIHTFWPGTAASINGVLWTLSVEAQFYALFPVLWGCFKRWPWLTGLGLIALAWGWRIIASRCCAGAGLALTGNNLPGYIDLFGCGMLCAWTFVRFGHRVREGAMRTIMPVVAVSGAVLVVAVMARHVAGEGSITVAGLPVIQPRLVLGVGFALLAFGGLCSPGAWPFALANPLLRFFATISYNLYLYNWMIAFALLWHHIPASSGNPETDPHWPLTFTAIALVASIGFAALVTYALERPLLRLPDPKWMFPKTGR